MTGLRRRAALLALAGAIFAGVAPAYYHYVHFNTRTGPWTPAYERFDVAALPGQTVSYFISDPRVVQLAPADTVGGLISQIRAGAKVWNGVSASQLRVAFGGIVPAGTQQSGPSIEVFFDEIPPGIVAYGGPQVLAENNGSFVPIVRSHVVLNKDLSARTSFSEAFFGTLVHEFGHALGLQHTLTSSTMSTGITRATTKGRPLEADDIAGLALLYPAVGYGKSTGVIIGRVTASGEPVNLASVVAVAVNGAAVSGMTLPDGTYRIEGIPPGQYLVYAHSLPPALTTQNETTSANITYPVDAEGKALPPGPTFHAQFYPGTGDPDRAATLNVTAGGLIENVNFDSQARGPLQIHSLQTYSFPAAVATKPAHLSASTSRPFVLVGGAGLMPNGAPAPGLTVQVLGGPQLPVKTYSQSNWYAQLDVDTQASFAAGGAGPRHLLFRTPTDLYLLPYGYIQTESGPPTVDDLGYIDADGVRAALVVGRELKESTRVLFDGIAGQTRGLDDSGRLLVIPPPAAAGARLNVVAINPDGQSSLFMRSETMAWSNDLGAPEGLRFSIEPAALPAGTDSFVTVDAPGASFAEGLVSVGFGSADVQARRVWVVSPTRLLVNVSVARAAALEPRDVTIFNGLHVLRQPAAFQPQAFSGRQIALSSRVVNKVTGTSYAHQGATLIASVLNWMIPASSNGFTLTLNDRPVPASAVAENTLEFEVPAGMPLGPVLLRVRVGSEVSLPVLINIDEPPPQITAVSSSGIAVDPGRGLRSGDTIFAVLRGLVVPGASVAASRVTVAMGEVVVPASQVMAQGAVHLVYFPLPPGTASGELTLTVTVDGRVSHPFTIQVQ